MGQAVRHHATEQFLTPVEAFLERTADKPERWELINGEEHVSPSPRGLHQNLLVVLSSFLFAFVQRGKRGKVFGEMDVYIDEESYVRPDISVYVNEDLEVLGGDLDQLPSPKALPRLVIEIVSPLYRAYDLDVKKNLYAKAGIPEYWVVDAEKREFMFFTLEDKTYHPLTVEENSFKESKALEGFELRISDVWESLS